MKRNLITAILICAMIVSISVAAISGVNLEWRPAAQIVHVGETVNLGLYAVSTSGTGWPVSSMDVIVSNTPAYLLYSNLVAVPGLWMSDGLFSADPDNINKNITDGMVMYNTWANLGQKTYMQPAGTLVTTFRFNARALVNETSVNIQPTYGVSCKTIVYDGTVPNLNVTGTLGAAKVMIVAQGTPVVNSVVAVKSKTDGSQVAVIGPIITRRFASFFYMEDPNRTSGIKVNCSGAPAEGTVAMVSGTLRNIAGEWVIDNAVAGSGGPGVMPRSIMMTGNATSIGLSPQGLLITLAGRASVTAGSSTFMLSDGSNQSVRVELHNVQPPDDNAFVAVIGALGADANGPVLRVNNPSDLLTMSE